MRAFTVRQRTRKIALDGLRQLAACDPGQDTPFTTAEEFLQEIGVIEDARNVPADVAEVLRSERQRYGMPVD